MRPPALSGVKREGPGSHKQYFRVKDGDTDRCKSRSPEGKANQENLLKDFQLPYKERLQNLFVCFCLEKRHVRGTWQRSLELQYAWCGDSGQRDVCHPLS